MDVKTIQTYNKTAEVYDKETIDFWDRFPRTFLDKFSELIQGKVLDVGSGPGRDGLLLKERGVDVICLDASEAMVKLCKQKDLKAILGDFNQIPFEDGSFDGVWAYTSLLHVSKADISKPLSEIWRVLKKDGIFGLGLIEGTVEEYRESSGIDMPRWFSFYTKEEVDDLFKKHGFTALYFEKFKPKTKNYLNFIAKKR